LKYSRFALWTPLMADKAKDAILGLVQVATSHGAQSTPCYKARGAGAGDAR
jgi:hypothetical protein